jgi:FimV-like protein
MLFLRLSLVFLFFISPSAVMADLAPAATPFTAVSLQATNKELLTASLLSLTQSVAKLAHAQAAVLDLLSFTQSRLMALQVKLQEIMLRLALGFMILFFLFLCLFEQCPAKTPQKQAKPLSADVRKPPNLSEENDIRDEYDFMATKQAIPAKLDLARAYKDMGDTGAARTTLEEVVTQGNEAQVREARQLLSALAH